MSNGLFNMHSGHQLAYAMWGMTGLSIVLVILRLYTRIKIVKFVGAEDYMYTLTGVSTLPHFTHTRLTTFHSYSYSVSLCLYKYQFTTDSAKTFGNSPFRTLQMLSFGPMSRILLLFLEMQWPSSRWASSYSVSSKYDGISWLFGARSSSQRRLLLSSL